MMQIDYKQFKNDKILITGGLGFVGVNLVERLLENDITPIILDFIPDGRDINERYLSFKINEITFYNTDITNAEAVKNIISKVQPDHLIHLAAMTNLVKDFNAAKLSVKININGTLNLLEAIHQSSKTKSFIMLSSSDVYGGVDPPFNEKQRVMPASPYSVSKASAEMYALLFQKIYEIPVSILRSFNVFGKYQRNNRVIPFIIQSLMKNEPVKLTLGEQKREFNYIENLIDAIFLTMSNQDSIGKILNIGNGESITIKKIAQIIAGKFSKEELLQFGAIPYRDNEIWDMFCDNSLAKKTLEWEPRIPLEQALDITIEWFKDNFQD